MEQKQEITGARNAKEIRESYQFPLHDSRISTDKPKSRDRSIEKAIKKLGIKIKEVKFSAGMVRCRINIKDEKDTWHTSLFENAFHVNSEIA